MEEFYENNDPTLSELRDIVDMSFKTISNQLGTISGAIRALEDLCEKNYNHDFKTKYYGPYERWDYCSLCGKKECISR